MHNNMNSADNNMVNMCKDMVGMDVDMRNTLVVILGPTGVGKTELCLRVAEHFDIPIINADSRQLFREIPVGTAAPTAELMAQYRAADNGIVVDCDLAGEFSGIADDTSAAKHTIVGYVHTFHKQVTAAHLRGALGCRTS